MYRTAVDMSMPPAQGLTPLNVSTAELTKKQHQASTKGASVQGYSHAASATGAVIGRRMITTTDVTKGTSIPLVRKIDLLYIKYASYKYSADVTNFVQ